jgi:hypothetical protein
MLLPSASIFQIVPHLIQQEGPWVVTKLWFYVDRWTLVSNWSLLLDVERMQRCCRGTWWRLFLFNKKILEGKIQISIKITNAVLVNRYTVWIWIQECWVFLCVALPVPRSYFEMATHFSITRRGNCVAYRSFFSKCNLIVSSAAMHRKDSGTNLLIPS